MFDVAPFDMPSLPIWYRSDEDWYSFLGCLGFHHFTWRVRWDHNAEWQNDFDRQLRLRHYELEGHIGDYQDAYFDA